MAFASPTTPTFSFQPRKVPHRRPRAHVPATTPLLMTGVIDLSGGEDDLTFTAVFNTTPGAPLASVGTADPLKWTARYGGSRFEGNALTLISPTSIRVEMVFVGYEAGPNQVSYAADPSDIADVLGRKLAAFAGFPV